MLFENSSDKTSKYHWKFGSTSNHNSKANYCLEQKANAIINEHTMFYNGPNGEAYNPAFPDFIRQGRMPANNFSFNAVDIESSLFNIGVCNLVDPKPVTLPRFKENLQSISFFKRPTLIDQKPFIGLRDQRPY